MQKPACGPMQKQFCGLNWHVLPFGLKPQPLNLTQIKDRNCYISFMSFWPKIEGKFPKFISLNRIMPLFFENAIYYEGEDGEYTNPRLR